MRSLGHGTRASALSHTSNQRLWTIACARQTCSTVHANAYLSTGTAIWGDSTTQAADGLSSFPLTSKRMSMASSALMSAAKSGTPSPAHMLFSAYISLLEMSMIFVAVLPHTLRTEPHSALLERCWFPACIVAKIRPSPLHLQSELTR